TASNTAGPEGFSHSASTTTYNANTGQTKTWNNGVPDNTSYAGLDGNVYKNDGSGWQQRTSNGWQSATGDTSWANRDQHARTSAQSSTFNFGSGGWDRSGSGSNTWSERWDGGNLGNSWGDRFGGDADRWGGGGGGGSWGSRFSSGGFGDRFGGFG